MLAKIVESHEIFERGHEAWAAKKADMSQHPALPEDKSRHDELKAEIQPWKEGLKHLTPEHMRTGYFASNMKETAVGRSRWTSFCVLWDDIPQTAETV